jgi:hypothetical protein
LRGQTKNLNWRAKFFKKINKWIQNKEY